MLELMFCGDVGLVSVYFQVLVNEEIGLVLVIFYLFLVGYLVFEFCLGEMLLMFMMFVIVNVMFDESGKGIFNW